MATVSYTPLVAGSLENVNDLNTILAAFATQVNGNLEAANLASGAVTSAKTDSTTINTPAGLSDSGATRRGKSIISTEETTTSAAFTTLTTPDRVQNVVLPTDGLIFVAYQALWKGSGVQSSLAAIFLGANQLKQAINNSAPQSTFGIASSGFTNYAPVFTDVNSTTSSLLGSFSQTTNSSNVTTGQVLGDAGLSLGAPLTIFAAAGTYTISVQFSTSAGTLSVKDRRLWVWTMGF